ncbi:TPA: nucleotidyltransferase domain-containing protein [Clostridium perfringens]|uniref:nucleotidyltransferase domain-containing protein n=1 Tax=Clostridium perfringens TaxID=1502 RepID=UPI000DA3560E|nr:nucleotidyltransferase domain-containing protein [Clostridium perfringens]EGT0694875.1 nucleotidyltransferase domain-containing protein [Clostridium perfringens]EGT2190749.1 nucleotidyltransferase domain-containing protein [Clostridium perfringens]EGT3602301.1 nucleotidyltransferase domain-containing protein [Clostridium perfringens]EHA0993203.1 nucleotidyltransferase domain-containing protein [Clostridium perfringens]EHA1183873.1 nucleotidyltransferase domain-containing protein [Clostridiu
MSEIILKYQNSFKSVINDLQKNEDVIGVTAFGSIINGDIWEGSDIDLFVIVNGDFKGVKDVYGEELGVSLHLKIVSKKFLVNFCQEEITGSTIHRKFISSKLIFCKDQEISDKFTSIKYYTDAHSEKWNLVYLSELLQDMNLYKKCIHNEHFYAAFEALMYSVDSFSRLYLNFNGYLITKSSTGMLMKLDENFEKMVNGIFKAADKQALEYVHFYIESFLERNIRGIIRALVDFMKKQKDYLSSEEIKKSEEFQGFKIDFEELLGYLYKKNIVKKSGREKFSPCGQKLITEKVYLIKDNV